MTERETLEKCRNFYMNRVKEVLSTHKLYNKKKPRPDYDLVVDFCRIVGKDIPERDKYLHFLADYYGWHHTEKIAGLRVKKPVSVTGFYRSDEWVKLRAEVLRLYGRRCMCCRVTNTIMHVDHIVPRSWNITLELEISNLQVLCKSCNEKKGHKSKVDYRSPLHLEQLERHLNGKKPR